MGKDATVFAEEEARRAAIKRDEEEQVALGGYVFIPQGLRRHFKRAKRHSSNQHDSRLYSMMPREITLARYARSARLLYHSNQDLHRNLYPSDIEDLISTSVCFDRALTSLSELERSSKAKSAIQIQRRAVFLVDMCLNGQYDIYIGLLQPKGNHILYEVTSAQSCMHHKKLLKGKGISFQCIDKNAILVCDDISTEASIECFGPHKCGPFAVVPLPNRTKRKSAKVSAIGVLAVDSTRRAWQSNPGAMSINDVGAFLSAYGLSECCERFQQHKIDGRAFLELTEFMLEFTLGIYRVHTRIKIMELVKGLNDGLQLHVPDPPVWFINQPQAMEFLQRVSDCVGPLIATARRTEWRKCLSDATKDGLCSQYELYRILINALLHCILNISAVSIWRVQMLPTEILRSSVIILASCDVPSDRMAPFTHMSEKGLKRIPMYKETSNSLLRGSIIRVNRTMAEKEDCTYTLSWSNQTIEELSWKMVEYQVAVRPLNTQHFQLQAILHGLEANSHDYLVDFAFNETKVWVQRFADEPGFVYLIQTTFGAQSHPADAMVYMAELLPELEIALRCIRGRQQRRAQRQSTMRKVKNWTANLNASPSKDVLESMDALLLLIAEEIKICLPGTAVAIFETQPNGKTLLCTHAYNNSMLFQNAWEDISLVTECLSTKATKIIRCYSEANFWTSSTEDISSVLPIVLVPIYHDDAQVGMLVVYNFNSAQKGRDDESHPEHGVVEMLEVAAEGIACILRLKRRAHQLYQLGQIIENAFATPAQLYQCAMDCIANSMLGVQKVRLVSISKVDGKAGIVLDRTATKLWLAIDVNYAEGTRARMNELLWSTLLEYHALPSEALEQIQLRVTQAESLLVKGTDVYALLKESPVPIELSKATRQIIDAAYQVVFGNQNFLSVLVPAICTELTLVALTVALPPCFCYSSEAKFLQTIVASMSESLLRLHHRYNRVRSRVQALHQLKNYVDNHLTIELPLPTPEDEQSADTRVDIQEEAIKLISGVLLGTNIYIGLLHPEEQVIRYTCASSRSLMKNKRLVKSKGGISFSCIQRQQSLVVTTVEQLEFKKLRHFGDPQEFQLPFVVIPIGQLGVLALDDFSKYGIEETQPEMGVLDFLVRVAECIEHGLSTTRSQTKAYRSMLRERALHDMLTLADNQMQSELHLQSRCIEFICHTFSGVNAYIGQVATNCNHITFTCASFNSNMRERTINITNSISFQCFRQQESIIIPHIEQVDRLYKFDSTTSGMFISVPIPYIGILSVDSFQGSSGGPYLGVIPEDGVVQCLESIADTLGRCIRSKRLNDSALKLKNVFSGNMSTFHSLFKAFVDELSTNLLSAIRIEVWYVFEDFSTESKYHINSTMHSSPGDLTRDFIEYILAATAPQPMPGHQQGHRIICPITLVDPYIDKKPTAAILITRLDNIDWEYDIHVLNTLLPVMNAALHLSSQRAIADVARRSALIAIKNLCLKMTKESSADAYDKLFLTQDECLNLMVQALGKGTDLYVAYLEPRFTEFSKVDRDGLVFRSASSESLMHNVVLDKEDLMSFQCIRIQEPIVINHLAQQSKTVCACTTRKATRAFAVVPLSTLGILSGDSFGATCFNIKNELEREVVVFLQAGAKLLVDLYEKTHQRYSYDRINACGNDIKAIYAEILNAVNRDITHLHCQQVLSLAADFTGEFHVECWHKFVARRKPVKHEHYCYIHRCRQAYVRQLIHYDTFSMPMTNCPKTLDAARSGALAPILSATGIEPRGNIPCFAAMIDGTMKIPRIALCVYRKPNRQFTERDVSTLHSIVETAQKAYFTAYTSLVLASMSIELMYFTKELLQARDGAVITQEKKKFIVKVSTNEVKHPLGTMKGSKKQTTRLSAFAGTKEICIIADITPPPKAPEIPVVQTVAAPVKTSRFPFPMKKESSQPKITAAPVATPPTQYEVIISLPGKEYIVLDMVLSVALSQENTITFMNKISQLVQECKDSVAEYLSTPNGNERLVAFELFLSKFIAQALFESNPFDVSIKVRVWTAAFRCRTFLSSNAILQLIDRLSESFQTMFHLILLIIASTKYLKHDADMKKQELQHLVDAAIQLQCRVRCIFAIRELAKRKKHYAAALIIQCASRQYLARCQLKYIRTSKAAIRLQQWYRKVKAPQKPTFSTKKLLEHVRLLQARYGAQDKDDTLVAGAWSNIGNGSYEEFLSSRQGKELLAKEERALAAKLKELAKTRAEMPIEERLQEEVRDLFDYYDYTGTGVISRDDTKNVIEKLRIPLVPEELDDVVSMIDFDKSGDVSLQEFVNWFTYEYPMLVKRSKDCGTMASATRTWFIHAMALRFLRQKYNIYVNHHKANV
ncbi:hypothetical protein THRCLA_08523 [Thraustotheca clavata]|uniref:Uncharacterized protein n=1 Tax=Thraustotheca clavata TaxID=74557 RepID=A0A1V9Z586_9STRA|nr:hypothetical protein THRCLA_08523 [Thraustotheca clavata]